MTEEVVVDTNVAVVANGCHDAADDACVSRCLHELRRIQHDCRLLLDDRWLILKQYQSKLGSRGQARPGDAFIKWALTNQGDEARVRQIAITPDPDRGFVEFPADAKLANFDNDDRKFAAVAIASATSSPVLNASDTDWWHYRDALQEHGITISFLCPELMHER